MLLFVFFACGSLFVGCVGVECSAGVMSLLVLLQNNLTFTAVKKNSEMRCRDCAFRRLLAELTGTRKQCPLRRHCL